ncbi:MAG TPA: glycoside hydrolase family 28 protein [Gemmatimonadaceae bacterium]|jgi:polygalacturonase|nr:glycoside hydrolase family 28 protein [Gemmatimonadaceae bacterium]
MSTPSRREFVKAVAATGAAALLPGIAAASSSGTGSSAKGVTALEEHGWARVPSILARIKPPKFKARDFPVVRYGAKADGTTDCTDAFRRAVAACSAAGGGRVVVSGGNFLTGPIHLKSHVNLHVAEDATILFSTEPSAYLPQVLTRFEGMELMGLSPLIYALDAVDVAVTGTGTLDGRASNENWWAWKGSARAGEKPGTLHQQPARDRLIKMVEDGVPVAQRVFVANDALRPPFIQPYRCRNVLVEGVTIKNSPMWEINPVLCTNVTVRGVKIDSHGPNNDGCDPESCRDVLIEKCVFDTGDDCIAIKSGRNADGRRIGVPSENIIIRDCEMRDGHGGVTIGSEISGGVRHVYAERCKMDSPHLDRALRLKSNAMRGGTLEHIYMRDVTVGQVADAVLHLDYLYEEGANGAFPPTVRDVELLRVTSGKSNYAIYLRGFDKGTIDDIRVVDCTFDKVAKPDVAEHVTGLVRRGVSVNGAKVG